MQSMNLVESELGTDQVSQDTREQLSHILVTMISPSERNQKPFDHVSHALQLSLATILLAYHPL